VRYPEDFVGKIIQGDALEVMREMPDGLVQCVVTSPPYWGLRDYGVPGQLGLEKTPEEYTAKMVEIFREVRRVLRKDATLWLNLGDSYAHNGACGGSSPCGDRQYRSDDKTKQENMKYRVPAGLKPKDLVGIPWRVAAIRCRCWNGSFDKGTTGLVNIEPGHVVVANRTGKIINVHSCGEERFKGFILNEEEKAEHDRWVQKYGREA
jgi:hypothetical protein